MLILPGGYGIPTPPGDYTHIPFHSDFASFSTRNSGNGGRGNWNPTATIYAGTAGYGGPLNGIAYTWKKVDGVWTKHQEGYISASGGLGSGPLVDNDRRNLGGGGGAKLPGQRRFGSDALGYNPNGTVLIRVYRKPGG